MNLWISLHVLLYRALELCGLDSQKKEDRWLEGIHDSSSSPFQLLTASSHSSILFSYLLTLFALHLCAYSISKPWSKSWLSLLSKRSTKPEEAPTSRALVNSPPQSPSQRRPILNSDQHSRHTGNFPNFNLRNHLSGRLIFRLLPPPDSYRLSHLCCRRRRRPRRPSEKKLRRSKREPTGLFYPQLQTANRIASIREEHS